MMVIFKSLMVLHLMLMPQGACHTHHKRCPVLISCHRHSGCIHKPICPPK